MPVSVNPDEGLWFRRFNQTAGGPVRLICFPHAGGAASHYFPLAQALAPEVAVLAVQYPGRQDRRREPRIESIPALADAITAAIGPLLDRPCAFFGHSMGAIVAFEVAQRLRGGKGPSADSEPLVPVPTRLFASGRRAPATLRNETVHQRNDAGLIAELVRLGGTDSRSLQNDDILAMALPPTRSDYKAIETYQYSPQPPLACPITVLSGNSDSHTSAAELDVWSTHTAADTEFHVFDGGHFFIDTCRLQVVSTIKAVLARDDAAQYAAK